MRGASFVRAIAAALLASVLMGCAHEAQSDYYRSAYELCRGVYGLAGTPQELKALGVDVKRDCRNDAATREAWHLAGEPTVHVTPDGCRFGEFSGKTALDCVPDSAGALKTVRVLAAREVRSELLVSVVERLRALGVVTVLIESGGVAQ